MLHVKFALSFEHLVDEMMDKIIGDWKDPMRCPVVIFPDNALKHWFKLRWIERRPKSASIANLNSRELEAFIFELLAGNAKKNEKEGTKAVCPFNVIILRNVILAWLRSHLDELESVLGKDVLRYLGAEHKPVQGDVKAIANDIVDENHLFDFADMMAWSFLEYEKTRPGNFMYGKEQGVFECWKDGKDFFGIDQIERWQRALYNAIFDGKDDLIHKLNKAHKDCDFQTYTEMYRSLERDSKGNIIFHYDSDLPVYIFWGAGMRQFYRVILDEFAKEHEVYAFIQNPCMAFWEDAYVPGNKHYTRKNIKEFDRIQPNYGNFEIDNEESDIYAENENFLLCKWGQAGRDNVRLWCDSVNYDFDMDSSEDDRPHTTLLGDIQHMIAVRENKMSHTVTSDDNVYFKEDPSFSLTGAPSKIREIEQLHSNICKLLIQDGVKASDILVVAPDMNKYRTAISQVFDQDSEFVKTIKKGQFNGEKKTPSLHIPLSIIDGRVNDSLTISALKVLLKIRANGALSRHDFFMLVNNALVQNVRGITPEDVNAWEGWVCGMNVYRDRPANDCDWTQGIYRLLLSRISSVSVDLGNCSNSDHDCCVPYQDIESSDENCLLRFVETVKSLESLIHDFKGDSLVFTNDGRRKTLDEFVGVMNSWIALNKVPKAMASENIIYQNVIRAIDALRIQNEVGLNELSWNCLELSVVDVAEKMPFTVGSLFVNGITFMNFTPNRIIPVDHLFFIGMDSSSFPGRSNRTTLDLRSQCKSWPGDVDITARNRYAFLCQLMSTRKSLHISYVNMDLKKDQPFYPSTMVNTVRGFLKNALSEQIVVDLKKVWPEISVSIDEIRPWSELFTGREFRNKYAYQHLIGTHADESQIVSFSRDSEQTQKNTDKSNTDIRPDRISIYHLENFCKDPFQFYVGRTLTEDDIEDVDPQEMEFEPLDLNYIEKTANFREIVFDMMNVANKFSDEEFKDILKELIDARIDVLKRDNLLPDKFYGEKIRAFLNVHCLGMCQLLKEQYCDKQNINEWPKQKNEDYTLTVFDNVDNDSSDENSGHRFAISGNRCLCIGDEIFNVKLSSPGDEVKDVLKQYITALVMMAEGKAFASSTVKFVNFGFDKGKAKKNSKKSMVVMEPESASALLQKIIRMAFGCRKEYAEEYFKKILGNVLLNDDEVNSKYKDIQNDDILKADIIKSFLGNCENGWYKGFISTVPVELLDEKIENLSELVEKLVDGFGSWQYFKKKNHFDFETQIGYQPEIFDIQWKFAVNLMKDLIVIPMNDSKSKQKADSEIGTSNPKNKRR